MSLLRLLLKRTRFTHALRVYDYYEPDERCEKFYTLGNSPAQLSVNCKKTEKRDSPTCVCGAARCPSNFKEHPNRLCEAQCRHSFAYMITVENIVPEGEWNVITLIVDEVLKQDAKKPVAEESEVNATIARVCDQKKLFKVGKKYPVQGMNRPKIVFDDEALVEKSPSKLADACIEKAPKKCKEPKSGFKKPCKEIRNRWKSRACKAYKKCVKKHEEKCQEKVDEGFECYVRKIK
ncbi:uncharacterized protein [Oscarella lobularis]|uniref:uncharacterized protein n=1 Tax=Oscarella lobularis TaxID=121494 RepID=UPI003313FE87